MLDAASRSSLANAVFSGNLKIAQPQVNIADRDPDQHQAKGVVGSAMIGRLMRSAMTNS
jgi:hypothetical protein